MMPPSKQKGRTAPTTARAALLMEANVSTAQSPCVQRSLMAEEGWKSPPP